MKEENKRFRILVVDDEPFNVDALKINLQCATVAIPNFNFASRIDSACNGKAAIDIVKQRYEEGLNFKFIMMDCNMPQMDGYESTKKIREYITSINQE